MPMQLSSKNAAQIERPLPSFTAGPRNAEIQGPLTSLKEGPIHEQPLRIRATQRLNKTIVGACLNSDVAPCVV